MSLSLERKQGLTLVEILVVIAIIAILLTLSFAGVAGVMEKAKRDEARLGMDIVQSALEDYRLRFGDYPREQSSYVSPVADAEQYLFNALMGKFAPDGTSISVEPLLNHSVLDLVSGAGLPVRSNSNTNPVANSVLDSWGNPYLYQYSPNSTSWTRSAYLLYSMGPDGKATRSVDGKVNSAAANNSDNIYAK